MERSRRSGEGRSGVFRTKAEATTWAAKVETDISTGKAGGIMHQTFCALLERYIQTHAASLDGAKQE